MSIRFRCQHCRALQSIASRKAGQVVKCAACDEEVVVPYEDQVDAPVEKPSAPAAAFLGNEGDRVRLPDDFFEFESPPHEPAPRPVWEPAGDEEFAAYEEPLLRAVAEKPVPEAPPLRPRGAELPEPFTLPLRRSRIDDEMDLTPMVDVVFQLLIFFMVTASFALHKTIQTPSPDPEQKGATQSIQSLDELEGVAIIVRIDGQNGITIDEEPLPDDAPLDDALRTKMRQEQKSEVIITADAAAWHRTVVKVVDAANAVGMQKIRLATRGGSED
jgi:biopolymer transport protein ExbD